MKRHENSYKQEWDFIWKSYQQILILFLLFLHFLILLDYSIKYYCRNPLQKLSFLLYIAQCIVDYSRQCKTQIVIGFIVSSRLICLELICTPKIGGDEYNLKDSGLIHALEPVLFLLFLFEFRSCVRVFSLPEFCTNNFKVISHDDYHNT